VRERRELEEGREGERERERRTTLLYDTVGPLCKPSELDWQASRVLLGTLWSKRATPRDPTRPPHAGASPGAVMPRGVVAALADVQHHAARPVVLLSFLRVSGRAATY